MVNHEQIIFKKEPLTKQIYYSIIIKTVISAYTRITISSRGQRVKRGIVILTEIKHKPCGHKKPESLWCQLFVTGGNGSCRHDNLRFHKWRQSLHHPRSSAIDIDMTKKIINVGSRILSNLVDRPELFTLYVPMWVMFNSLRPSDAYMRRYSNHHWSR